MQLNVVVPKTAVIEKLLRERQLNAAMRETATLSYAKICSYENAEAAVIKKLLRERQLNAAMSKFSVIKMQLNAVIPKVSVIKTCLCLRQLNTDILKAAVIKK